MKTRALAGGSGKRLWPLSREQNPKQFFELGDHSFRQDIIFRSFESPNTPKVFAITDIIKRSSVPDKIEERVHGLIEENDFLKPEGKNSFPTVTFRIEAIGKKFRKPTSWIFYLGSARDGVSNKTINNAEQLTTKYPVAFEILPTHPPANYGYARPAKVHGCGYRVSGFWKTLSFETIKYTGRSCFKNSRLLLFNTNDKKALSCQTVYHSLRVYHILDPLTNLKKLLSISVNLSGQSIRRETKKINPTIDPGNQFCSRG